MIERGAIFTPLPTARQFQARLLSGKWRTTDIGMQARCSQCREYWPADTDFFDRHVSSGLASICKACCAERKIKTYNLARSRQQQGA